MKLPGKIKALAVKDPFAAELLASRGKVFSELEEDLWLYLFTIELWRDPKITKEERHALEHYAMEFGQKLCDRFLDSVARLDPSKLFEIAEAVAEFKKRGKSLRKWLAADNDRANLLCLAQLGRKFPCGKLAKATDYKGSMDHFRRMVRELRIPHLKETGGRPDK